MSSDAGADGLKEPVALMANTETHSVVMTFEHRFKRGRSGDFKLVEAESSDVEVRELKGPIARVKRSYGLTINLDNYESARFDVSIEVPCELMDVEAADAFAEAFCEERVVREKNSLGSGGG
jgi:hypothetical protein